MAELDFSALNKLAYRGFETAEEQEQKDVMTAQGFTLVEEEENPFLQASGTASEPPQASAQTKPTTPRKAAQGRAETFMSASGTRNYKALYRAAHDYHIQHAPPVVDRAYWETHTAGKDEPPQAELDYWAEAAADVSATARAFGNDPFLIGLLVAVYEELEREYQDLNGYSKRTAER